MSEEWVSIYRGYDDAALTDEIAFLKTQSRNLLQSQTVGQRGYTRSTAEVRDRLQAALQVQRERGQGTDATGPLFPDFSEVQP